ncbi:2-hydroxyacid dehydrogenase [Caenimonas soli]|uniref:2-hydroxyacid dehydrogenase n=1 Tax=Caenimonas soli TaxID=2735555 RepID=UPI001554D716|nr:2-hydroxyacid dehydrogenase [Caenimonas soli]NPC58104.1 dehydrogenase [Caenimonas soli]
MTLLSNSASAGRTPRVFAVHDHMLEPLFDGIVEDLERNGVDVLRGPSSKPGDKPSVLPPSYMERLLQADVAMFSSRSLCTGEMLAACAPSLRAVVNPTIGVETVDLAAAGELGILVGNGSTPENYIGMAEAAVMFMLNLFYGLRTTEQHLRENRPRPAPDQVHARTLRGKTIGILGLGNIGRSVARLLQPFDVKVLAYSPHADPDSVPAGVQLASLDEVMARSDLVCICIAVTPSNRQLVNERTLGLMKRSAYLVNVARGDAIDEPALVRVLQERRIAGAALDTFALEPLPMDSPLRRLDNVILTPHAVGYTKENVDSLRAAAVENIRRVLAGLPPLHCKNPAAQKKWAARVAGMESLRSWNAAAHS